MEQPTMVVEHLLNDVPNESSYYKWLCEDKSKYPHAKDVVNPRTGQKYIDPDDDFLIGESGGFLFNLTFTFINTHLLSPAAKVFEKKGKYVDATIDSPAYTHFRKQEEDRRRNGYTAPCKLLPNGTITNLTISGAHYNFLNYSQIMRIEPDSIKLGSVTAKKKKGFPRFFGGQYWNYKVREFAKLNGFHLVVGKSRRGGYSYMEGNDSANDINLNPDLVVIHAAYDKKYLTEARAISPMALDQLEFYEKYTPFKRGILSRDLADLELGYKDKSGARLGYQSHIFTVSFGPNNPDVAAGKDAYKIKLDELNNAPNLKKFLEITLPTTTTGAYLTGQIIGFGTGGSTEGDWETFEEWFYNPGLYGAMPFENVWDDDARHEVCGFFKPYFEALEGQDEFGNFAMDQDGNTNYLVAMRISDKERQLKRNEKGVTDSDFVAHCAQYANRPSESFSSSNQNIFTSPELNQQINRLQSDKSLQFHRDGMIVITEQGHLRFKTNAQLQAEGAVTHPYITKVPFNKGDDVTGCVREWFPPFRDANGKVPDNLYRVWHDPFGADKDKDTITTKNSLGSTFVYLMYNNITRHPGGIIVAEYTGRPESLEEYDRNLANLIEYYNAKMLFECDRGQVVQHFKTWRKLNRLATEPNFTWDTSLQGKQSTKYGIAMGSGSSNRRINGIGYLREELYQPRQKDETLTNTLNLHYIYSLPLLLELRKWKLKGNFDRVSAMIIGMYDIKETTYNILTKPKPVRNNNTNTILSNLRKGNWYK